MKPCPRWVSQHRSPNKLDHCPVCKRHILDMDMTGCEGDDGQRWCVAHLPDDHPQAGLKSAEHGGGVDVVLTSGVPFTIDTDEVFRLLIGAGYTVNSIRVVDRQALELEWLP